MRPTETGGDTVFAHADPNSGPCAALPPDDGAPGMKNRSVNPAVDADPPEMPWPAPIDRMIRFHD